MPYYRVTYEGYIEGEYDNAEEAKHDFMKYIVNDEIDQYDRTWMDSIAVEEYDEKTEKWK